MATHHTHHASLPHPSLGTEVRVGARLAASQLKRANPWTNVLILFVMVLTFLNLVVVSGILVGLIEGAVVAVKERYSSDIMITPLKNKSYIIETHPITSVIDTLPEVEAYTSRFIAAGTVESGYKETAAQRKPGDLKDVASTQLTGIDPELEDRVSHLSHVVIQGSYLERNDYDSVLVGAMLLKQYLDFESPMFTTLSGVSIGSRIRVTVNGNQREVTVKGIVKSKVDEIDRRIFFVDQQLRGLMGKTDFNASEIVLKLKPGFEPTAVKAKVLATGAGDFARVQTYEEAEPKFIKDMKETFSILGNAISSIGLVVASITIFIVIFINAITRRKYIGIMKGIGISSRSIEIAYVLQSLAYAFVGSLIGFLILYGLIKPYFDANPINFPFSDGILVATLPGTLQRIGFLILTTLIAGYIPAKIVIRKNTLDSILGR